MKRSAHILFLLSALSASAGVDILLGNRSEKTWGGVGGVRVAQWAGAAWTPLALAPAAWWTGDATTNDASGYAHNGAWAGAAAYTNGVNGSAFWFGGSSTVIAAHFAEMGATNMTVCCWVRGAHSTAIKTIVSARDSSTVGWFAYAAGTTDNLRFGAATGSGTVTLEDGAMASNTWMHVAATVSATNATLWVDGEFVTQNAVAYAPPQTSALNIGSLTDSGPRLYLTGAVDDVMVFGRILSPAEISKIYNWRQ